MAAGGRNYAGRVKMLGGQDLITKYATEQEFESESAFARFLHEIEPTRSVHGWRTAIFRWKGKGGHITYTVFNGKKKAIVDNSHLPPEIQKQYAIEPPKGVKTYYDDKKDIYLTFIQQANQIVEVDGNTHRLMKKNYSNEGGRLTISEMSSEYSFPILWMQDYIKAHNWRHPMSPYTDEEMIEKTEDELVVDYLELKRNSAIKRSKRAHYAAMAKDAHKWRTINEAFYNDFKESLGKGCLPRKKAPKIKMGTSDPSNILR